MRRGKGMRERKETTHRKAEESKEWQREGANVGECDRGCRGYS